MDSMASATSWAGASRAKATAASSSWPRPTILSSSMLTLRVRSVFGTGLLLLFAGRSEPRAYQA